MRFEYGEKSGIGGTWGNGFPKKGKFPGFVVPGESFKNGGGLF